MPHPVQAIVKKHIPGARAQKQPDGARVWRRVTPSKLSRFELRVSGTDDPAAVRAEALWKTLCAALTVSLGKPVQKKSGDMRWDTARCWHHAEAAGRSGGIAYVVSVEAS